jgi:hypothetical protein
MRKGLKAIAAALQCNYLFIPIVHYKMRNQDIGNAILSKSNIENPEKTYFAE